MTQSHKRRIKLIRPRMQLELVACFAGLIAVSLLLQSLILGNALESAARELPGVTPELLGHLPAVQVRVLGLGLALILPIVVAFGVLLTFRIAGPIHRFEQFLGAVSRGEQVHPCAIRKDDELHDLCDAVNAGTAAERKRAIKNAALDIAPAPPAPSAAGSRRAG